MKKIIFFIASALLIIVGFYSYVLGVDDEEIIISKANECLKSLTSPMPSASSQITNPYFENRYLACKGTSNQEALYQVLLDLLFSKVDSDIEDYISSLSSRQADIALFNEVSNKFGDDYVQKTSFANSYRYVCSHKIKENAAKILGNLSTDFSTVDYFGQDNKCTNLYKIKLQAYESVAKTILSKNKINLFTKDKKDFMTKTKEGFEVLLGKFDRYIGKMGVVKDGWNTKTENVKQ